MSTSRVQPLDEPRQAERRYLGGLSSVQELDLTVNDISAEGIRGLLDSPHLTSLTGLNLWGLGLGSDLAEGLASAPCFSRITHLNLGGNTLGPEGTALLASSPHAPHLLALAIEENRIRNAGLQALLASEISSCLTTLNLEHNRLTDDGVRALARAPSLTSLTTLSLAWNFHTVDALVELRHAQQLRPELRDGVQLPTLDGVERKLEAWLGHSEDALFEVFRDGVEVIARRLEPMFPDQGMTEEYDMVIFLMQEGRLHLHYQTFAPISVLRPDSRGAMSSQDGAERWLAISVNLRGVLLYVDSAGGSMKLILVHRTSSISKFDNVQKNIDSYPCPEPSTRLRR